MKSRSQSLFQKISLIQLIFIILIRYTALSINVPKDESFECKKLPEHVLAMILGPAFNERYMSVYNPYDNISGNIGSKRAPELEDDLSVNPNYTNDDLFEDEPAWEIKSHISLDKRSNNELRRKRNTNSYKQEWSCKSQVVWQDLGPDYFPRYLKSISCVRAKCWFNIYKCKPRSFTVKLLRRRNNKCVKTNIVKYKHKIGTSGLPVELAELWVWEERAVTFCCDCGL